MCRSWLCFFSPQARSTGSSNDIIWQVNIHVYNSQNIYITLILITGNMIKITYRSTALSVKKIPTGFSVNSGIVFYTLNVFKIDAKLHFFSYATGVVRFKWHSIHLISNGGIHTFHSVGISHGLVRISKISAYFLSQGLQNWGQSYPEWLEKERMKITSWKHIPYWQYLMHKFLAWKFTGALQLLVVHAVQMGAIRANMFFVSKRSI